MPVPLLVFIALGVTSLLVGTTITMTWDALQVALRGKRVAILGARGVGKTHLTGFLSLGSIPEGYKQTLAPEKSLGRRFQLRDLDLKIKHSLDVSGDKAAYGEWKELHDQADIVFYLLRADRLIAGDVDTENRVRDDLRHIGGWLAARQPRPMLFIIGTHCDFDAEFGTLSPDRMGDYVDRFRRLPVVTELVSRGGGAVQAKVVLGSLKTFEHTEALVYQIFMQVAP